MKKLSLILVLLLVTGCNCSQESKIAQVLKGTHMLRQIGSREVTTSSWSGGFFLIAGGASGQTVSEIKVTFAWQGNDGAYQFETLPLDKIHIQLDDHVVIPCVHFKWIEGWPDDPDLASNWIRYAVLEVNPKDWPIKINIPRVP